jgi:ATP-dependent exoDNAse (exonuclease V) alpha subunit
MTLIDFPIKEGEVNKVYVSKDIDYAFALTVHKLQGSTIQNTYVDLNDMLFYSNGRAVMNSNFSPNAIQIRNKLVYTALSRTSKIAHIYLNIKR